MTHARKNRIVTMKHASISSVGVEKLELFATPGEIVTMDAARVCSIENAKVLLHSMGTATRIPIVSRGSVEEADVLMEKPAVHADLTRTALTADASTTFAATEFSMIPVDTTLIATATSV